MAIEISRALNSNKLRMVIIGRMGQNDTPCFPNNLARIRKSAVPTLTQIDLANKAGFTQSQISMWEKGHRSMTNTQAKSLAQVLKCKVADILDEFNEPRVDDTKLTGEVHANGVIRAATDTSKVRVPRLLGNGNFEALRMAIEYPNIGAGDLLFYGSERIPGVPAEWLDKICVVEIEDGTQLLKRIQAGSSVGRYHLEDLDEKSPTLQNTKVIWSSKVEAFVPH